MILTGYEAFVVLGADPVKNYLSFQFSQNYTILVSDFEIMSPCVKTFAAKKIYDNDCITLVTALKKIRKTKLIVIVTANKIGCFQIYGQEFAR